MSLGILVWDYLHINIVVMLSVCKFYYKEIWFSELHLYFDLLHVLLLYSVLLSY
jgi:hypothetical protein